MQRDRKFAQVAERLMAADCKSAAPWSYGGSNPPLCTRVENVSRFAIAMICFAALAVAAWRTLDDPQMKNVRAVTVAVIASFAVRTWLAHRAETRKQSDSEQVRPM
jgi:hypothetical protein